MSEAKCRNCGADLSYARGVYQNVTRFVDSYKCGSTDSNNGFHESYDCLRNQLAQRTAERDALQARVVELDKVFQFLGDSIWLPNETRHWINGLRATIETDVARVKLHVVEEFNAMYEANLRAELDIEDSWRTAAEYAMHVTLKEYRERAGGEKS